MLTAGAGRLVSPFANDPFALVALAFKNLYPNGNTQPILCRR